MTEHLEHLLEQVKKAEGQAAEIHGILHRINEVPRGVLAKEMRWMSREEVNKMYGVIDWARGGAISRLNAMTAELETLHAALDDSIGHVGRMV